MQQLSFVLENNKLKITSKYMLGHTDATLTKIDVNVTKKVKTLLLDFQQAYNLEDKLERFIYLNFLYLRFQGVKEDNQGIYDYFLKTWINAFHSLHKLLFPNIVKYEFPPSKILVPVKEKEKKISSVKKKKKSIIKDRRI